MCGFDVSLPVTTLHSSPGHRDLTPMNNMSHTGHSWYLHSLGPGAGHTCVGGETPVSTGVWVWWPALVSGARIQMSHSSLSCDPSIPSSCFTRISLSPGLIGLLAECCYSSDALSIVSGVRPLQVYEVIASVEDSQLFRGTCEFVKIYIIEIDI